MAMFTSRFLNKTKKKFADTKIIPTFAIPKGNKTKKLKKNKKKLKEKH